jgi:oligosaccharide repeat unit polymerase
VSVDAVIVLMAVLVLGNYWLSRSVLYPPFLFCSMWLLALSLYRMDLITTDLVHPNTLGFLGLGGVLFSSGGLLAMLFPKDLIATRLVLTRFPARNKVVKYLVILFLLCGLPLLLRNLVGMASHGVGDTIFQRGRTGGVDAAGSADAASGVSSLGAYFILWPYYAASLFLIEGRDKSFWLTTAIAFVAGLLSTGRLPVLMLMASLIGGYLITTNRQTFLAALKFVRVPLILFFSLYFGLTLLNKDTSSYEGLYGSGVAGILVFFLVSYIVGPTAALDYFMQHTSEYAAVPHHTFKFFLGIAAKLHLYPPQPVVGFGEFLMVPYPTNVYTVYQDYILDFGLYGALIAIFLIGMFQTLLYRKARTGSELGIYFFSITLFAVFLAPFSNEYSAFGSYIDAFLFAAIYIILRSIPLRVLPRLSSGYGKQLGPNH